MDCKERRLQGKRDMDLGRSHLIYLPEIDSEREVLKGKFPTTKVQKHPGEKSHRRGRKKFTGREIDVEGTNISRKMRFQIERIGMALPSAEMKKAETATGGRGKRTTGKGKSLRKEG